KIAIIGGGSSTFVPKLMASIIQSDNFSDSVVTLMDINEQRMEVMDTLSKKMIEEKNSDVTVESTTDRREALKDADFVIITISVGGFEAWEKDIEIPAKYGIYMPIADSVGPGGMMRAFRHIPVMVNLCKELEELSPEATVFNYSNPVTSCSMAMTRKTSIENIGLCSCSAIPKNGEFMSKKTENDDIDAEDIVTPGFVGGLNHCTGITIMETKDGRDVLEMIKNNTSDRMYNFALKYYGVFPYCGNHWSEFFPQFCYLKDEYEGKLQGLEMDFGASWEFKVHDMEKERKRVKKWDNLAKEFTEGEKNIDSLDVLPGGEKIEVIEIMESIMNNTNNIHIVNTLNRGAISNLPDDSIVEVASVVGQYGIKPIVVGDLNESYAAVLKKHIRTQELTVEAAISGDRDIALEAFLHDPVTSSRLSLKETEELLDELLEAHSDSLELFN
ncbi:MAG: hypothetical protein ACOC1S_00145, partial [bacterium]